MDPILWPTRLLVPANVKLALQNASRSGGAGLGGGEQVVASPAGRWTIGFSGLAIRTADQVRAWRAIEALTDGRANPILLPIYDKARGPVAAAMAAGVALDDAAPFLPEASAITLAAPAAVNAVTLTLAWTGPAPLPGQHFSVGGRLHRIARLDGNVATIRPWLRAPIAAGTALEFDAPTCLVRLAQDDGMALDLQLWRTAAAAVEFVEYF